MSVDWPLGCWSLSRPDNKPRICFMVSSLFSSLSCHHPSSKEIYDITVKADLFVEDYRKYYLCYELVCINLFK